jgi:hypothetical protein
MTGSGLIDFVITLIVICGVGALFFITIDWMKVDATMKKIAKIAIGVVLAVVILLAIKAVLFGGGGAALSGGGIIGFAIGIIVLLVVLYIVDVLLGWLAANMGIGAPIIDIVRYLVFAIALIALLVLADRSFFGGRYIGASLGLDTPSIMKPEKR